MATVSQAYCRWKAFPATGFSFPASETNLKACSILYDSLSLTDEEGTAKESVPQQEVDCWQAILLVSPFISPIITLRPNQTEMQSVLLHSDECIDPRV